MGNRSIGNATLTIYAAARPQPRPVFDMRRPVLITGAAGCIGSDLAARLVEKGLEVIAVDNLSSGREEHLGALLHRPNFRFMKGDLLDREVLDTAMQGVEMVYHLAANPDVKFAEGEATDKDVQQNILVTYNVLESMRVHGCRRLAFASTSAVYGIVKRLPIPEDHPCHPISMYGATKLSCEAMIQAFQHLFGIQSWIFRFANIVGPKVRKKGRTVISDFIARLRADPHHLSILGDGFQAKSYLLSSECVDGMLFAVRHADGPCNIYNLGCADSLQVREIAEMVVESMGLNGVEFHFTGGEGGWPGDVPRFTLDVSAINRLGWHACHSSAEAVALAIRDNLHQSRSLCLCNP